MADDRLVIICRTCRVGKAFAKRLGFWYSVPKCEEKLDAFLGRHQDCGDFERPWDFAYENDRDSLGDRIAWTYEQDPPPPGPPGFDT